MSRDYSRSATRQEPAETAVILSFGIPRESKQAPAVLANEEILLQGNPDLAPERKRSFALHLDRERRVVRIGTAVTGKARTVVAAKFLQCRHALRAWLRNDGFIASRIEPVDQRFLDVEPQIAAFAVIDDEETRVLFGQDGKQGGEPADVAAVLGDGPAIHAVHLHAKAPAGNGGVDGGLLHMHRSRLCRREDLPAMSAPFGQMHEKEPAHVRGRCRDR